MTTYSSLTATQREQAAWLFADELLGNDPTQYEYELIGEAVVGRYRIAKAGDTAHAKKPHTVAVNLAVSEVPDAFVTVEMNRRSDLAIQSLARRIVERIIQSQPVEA